MFVNIFIESVTAEDTTTDLEIVSNGSTTEPSVDQYIPKQSVSAIIICKLSGNSVIYQNTDIQSDLYIYAIQARHLIIRHNTCN